MKRIIDLILGILLRPWLPWHLPAEMGSMKVIVCHHHNLGVLGGKIKRIAQEVVIESGGEVLEEDASWNHLAIVFTLCHSRVKWLSEDGTIDREEQGLWLQVAMFRHEGERNRLYVNTQTIAEGLAFEADKLVAGLAHNLRAYLQGVARDKCATS